VAGVGRDVQHFAFADDDLLVLDPELERSLQHVGHLLAGMRMHGHERPLLQVGLGQHLMHARDDLLRHQFGDLFKRNLVPAVQAGRHRKGLRIVP